MDSSAVHINRAQMRALRDSLTKLINRQPGTDAVLIQFNEQPSMLHLTTNREGKRSYMIDPEGHVS